MWFYVVYVDINIVKIKFKKFSKFKNRGKFLNFKNKAFTRSFCQSRVERNVFFVMQFSRRSKRIEKKRIAIFFFRVSNSNSVEKWKNFFLNMQREQ